MNHDQWSNFATRRFLSLLLMEEIPNNHLGCIKPVVNNGIFTISTDAGFQPSTGWSYTSPMQQLTQKKLSGLKTVPPRILNKRFRYPKTTKTEIKPSQILGGLSL